MLRLTKTLLCLAVFGQVLIHASPTESKAEHHLMDIVKGAPRSSRQQSSRSDIDLTELTPNLERQLNQASRLNQADSIDDELPNEVAGGTSRSDNWHGRYNSMGGFNKRRSPSSFRNYYPASRYSPRQIMLYDQEEDNGHEFYGQPLAHRSIDNQESAARDSLWSSDRLRDLLILQEARRRARKLGWGDPNSRYRCERDPHVEMSNPAYCDTEDYFAAKEYHDADYWNAAGR